MTKYIVWCPELGSTADDGKTISAYDEFEAAAMWARREDAESADYWIVGGEGTTVIVRDPFGNDKILRVLGEPCINYTARIVAATHKAHR